MDWKPLLSQQVVYTGEPAAAGSLEERIRAAGASHRGRLRALGQLLEEYRALTPEPEPPTGWLERLLGRAPSAIGHLDRLEARLEAAQRRVQWLAHRSDRVAAEVALLSAELAPLEGRIAAAGADARRAAAAVIALEAGWVAARQADHHDAHRLEAQMRLREVERIRHRETEARLREWAALQDQLLRLHERLLGALRQLHASECAALDELDRELPHLASDARARDLAHAASTLDVEGVHRVSLAAREGAFFVADVDRLREEVDLLAPTDTRRLTAEAEVLAALQPVSIAELVARARAEIGRTR